ncbi:mediator of RNA polymerase II transcription subunit 8 isoform X1 [Zingiber officinale]|uniref:mediator of RNA polymerase II transcription subunit 8 isoform X1 n=1 Tax=Zingiber officinale TaxID=94328 RepID=UPI001C4A7DA4|nr:mediator of RNA polymerase II transcription subunit 8 isoform X1 [Zingiber officinale]
MEADGGAAPSQGQLAPPAVEAVAPPKVERLNPVVQQQLNLESVKTRALGLYKTISHILEDFEAFARSNTTPKWQDALGQFSMVSMDLFNIVEDIKNVSKAFVVYPRNVNAENATILPVMLSSKLLPEMEAEDTTKREQLLLGISGLPVHMQIEKLKTRIDMIGAACEAAEKVISDCRKAYGLGSRQGPTLVPTLDKVQAAKIQEQENLLRAAVNFGEGFRIPIDQRQLPTSLPSHLADVLSFGDGAQNLGDNAGAYGKNTSSFSSNQGVLQTAGGQLIGRSVPSPSNAVSFDNASTPPMAYANSPRSGTNIMNTPSPQQQVQQQQQQRQKILQLPHQQQLLVQQQLRQSSAAGVLGQGVMSQLHDLTGQTQQKLQQHQMSYSQPMLQQQFQNRQLQTSHMPHNIAQNQINQGSQLRSHINQFSGSANSALFNAAQSSPNSQMITNMSASMQSQSLLPRIQFGLTGGHTQRNHPSQMLNDQMFGMGPSNPANMIAMQQQQQGGFGNISTHTQNLQSGMVNLPNTTQNPNFPQQRQQNQS